MAGIYEPTSGQIFVDGKVASIFDVGGGMDAESTGYENIMLRGLSLGLSRAEIGSKKAAIAEFTELGSFLDMPIRTYSAGMQMRLAFAISTSIEPNILLLDEAVEAGDAAFLSKAQRRLGELIQRAGILVLASHVEETIRRLCTSAIILERGRIIAAGTVDEVLERYAPHDQALAPATH
jgi:ABC-2 type transport system ATP-binding protein/lipopolysaccharide transport system ATP-binding protein